MSIPLVLSPRSQNLNISSLLFLLANPCFFMADSFMFLRFCSLICSNIMISCLLGRYSAFISDPFWVGPLTLPYMISKGLTACLSSLPLEIPTIMQMTKRSIRRAAEPKIIHPFVLMLRLQLIVTSLFIAGVGEGTGLKYIVLVFVLGRTTTELTSGLACSITFPIVNT